MVFVTGPLCSGKRTFAQKLGGRQVYDVQDLAADAADLNRLADGEEMLVILAHGGTQMAALERYGVPRRSYYRWCGPNAGGYVLDARDWAARHELRLVKTVQYTKESTC